jgi:hypothetical protein
MFSEILKIIPRLESKDLQSMERALSTRFTKVAKGFGKGIMNVFKGGGIAGIALGLIDKVLNPLKETQEAIDRALSSSDDIATNANQFNTTTGKLFKLVQLAKATGLDQGNLFTLITKFQTAVAEAKANPAVQTAVSNFTDTPDTIEGFFEFIQAVQRMEKSQQVLVQQQVFGEKQILKMADFLQQDFGKLYSAIGLDKVTSAKLTTSVEKLAGLNDLQDILASRREVGDVAAKSGLINESMIRARDKSERIALEKENKRIASYEDLAAISDTTAKIMTMVETGIGLLGKLINTITPSVNRIIDYLDKFSKASIFRGLFKFGKDK